jgi:hypothetical protein
MDNREHKFVEFNCIYAPNITTNKIFLEINVIVRLQDQCHCKSARARRKRMVQNSSTFCQLLLFGSSEPLEFRCLCKCGGTANTKRDRTRYSEIEMTERCGYRLYHLAGSQVRSVIELLTWTMQQPP